MADDKIPKRTAQIIPFGKYKGQPVEVLAQDQQYVDWLMAQDWFRDRYQNFYIQIVNNFQEPTETPAHNAMQAEFLDQAFCRRFIEEVIYTPVDLLNDVRAYLMETQNYFRWGLKKWLEIQKDRECDENVKSMQSAIAATDEWLSALIHPPAISLGLAVEHLGWDVILEAKWCQEWEAQKHPEMYRSYTPHFSRELSIHIELKPELGDDYPAVYRQMNTRKLNTGCGRIIKILLIGDYTGQGASLKQVRQFFATGNFRLLLRHEIEKLPF